MLDYEFEKAGSGEVKRDKESLGERAALVVSTSAIVEDLLTRFRIFTGCLQGLSGSVR